MVLLTGFEPFTTGQGLVLTDNPTGEIVTSVSARFSKCASGVLPVSYARTPLALEALFEAHQPRAWIGLGFAPHRESLDIELVALNIAHAQRGDNDGACPTMARIIEGAPLAYETSLDISAAMTHFEACGVEAHVAFHAGTFLCNQVFFLGCHRKALGRFALELAAFIHVPPMENFGPFSEGLASLVAALIGPERARLIRS